MAADLFGIVGTLQAGTYRVEKVVAEGGFGVVYRAFHESFRAPVALKCLKVPSEMAPEHQAEFLEKFRAEGELLFRLSSTLPAVVRPLHVDALTTPSGQFVPFMALEWLTGTTLSELVDGRRANGEPPLDVRALVELLGPVARALARAHAFVTEQGTISIVHRDLKPDNLFIADVHGERVVKILDFGIAKARSAATQIVGKQSAHKSALVAFSPGFAAPEQWVPKRFGQTGPWTDVFSLALTMVEVLRGYAHPEGEPGDFMQAAVNEAFRPTPRNRGVEVTDAVEAVFGRALAVDPRQRYQNAGEFWDDLCRAVGVEIVVPSAPVRLSAPPTDPPEQSSPLPRRFDVQVPKLAAIPDLQIELDLPPSLPPRSAPRTEAAAPSARAAVAPAPVARDVGAGATTPLVASERLDAPASSGRPTNAARSPAPAAPARPAVGLELGAEPPGLGVSSAPPTSGLELSPVRPIPRPSAHYGAMRRSSAPPPSSAIVRFVAPAALFVVGLAIEIGVNVYASSTGKIALLGSVPLTTIGGGLAGLGLAVGVYRFFKDE